MAEHTCMGKSLYTIVKRLEGFAPLAYASSWDNVGLLVDPMTDTNVDLIMMTNDLTEDVLHEAIDAKVGLVISYHPNIFQGFKSVTRRTWKERLIIECIKNKIGVYSPHTTWDAVAGGVNDWLARCLPLDKSEPIVPLVNLPTIGAGRSCVLKYPTSIRTIVDNLKALIKIDYVRLALGRNHTLDTELKTVALCAGSGGSILNGFNAELYLTGEMLHHDILDATQRGVSVILCNHSDSERGFLNYFAKTLEDEVLQGDAKVIISKVDRDPLVTI